ncbi:hypothetical protein GZ78_24430 [Endozoicomonas numazuensis]|uniref:DUF2269 domain-containing protein n=1 Tax=Endozoicomonas numazuensis TaxID=1137799 RepID=A0A081N9A8_9GAMM|nr:hypothetical protein GZ78_24430 [Endozoicomonas numazuensis]
MKSRILKLIHLGSLILWLGPALGSWLVLRYSQQKAGELSATTSLIYKVFFFTITLEHLAFVSLLASGFMLAYSYHLFSLEWLHYKLAIVLLIVVPLEVVDVWLGNWKIQKLINKRNSGNRLSERENAYIHFYHKTFTYIALVAIPVSVMAIMWFAITKTV